MPLGEGEHFPARLQKWNRIQIPVLIRWKHKLERGEVVYVKVYSPESYRDETFYVRLLKDGRVTVPKLVTELLEIKPGDVVYVTLYPSKQTEEE